MLQKQLLTHRTPDEEVIGRLDCRGLSGRGWRLCEGQRSLLIDEHSMGRVRETRSGVECGEIVIREEVERPAATSVGYWNNAGVCYPLST